MKKIMTLVAMPLVFSIVSIIAFIQPACTGIYHEAEMPEEMMK